MEVEIEISGIQKKCKWKQKLVVVELETELCIEIKKVEIEKNGI